MLKTPPTAEMKKEEEREKREEVNKERHDRGEFGPDIGINEELGYEELRLFAKICP